MIGLDNLIRYEEDQAKFYSWRADNCKKHPLLSLGVDPAIHESNVEIHQSVVNYLKELKQYREKYGRQDVTAEIE